MSIINISKEEEFNNIIKDIKPSCILFSADWAEQCHQILEVFSELSTKHKGINFVNIVAEDFSNIALKNQIEAVPTVLFFQNGKTIDRIDGLDVHTLIVKCKNLVGESKESLEDRLKNLINRAKVMVFMKGAKDAPRCGFSKQLMTILNDTGVAFETFDILSDEDVRQGLKIYSDWPTYPQVYVKGELIGGLDIVKELVSSGELLTTLQG
ncbi:glutaredoxin 3 [Condylostylus longicornis]|uniref:glutaredoxin 3 n=1 Tax=Condylostylus longicornis TaxID=2530218 RepID=UPI00244E4B59|nr:glutaredoxin 3 [Condylostylus longicornis]